MTDVREATDNLLAEKPDFEADLRDLLTVNDRTDGWTFDGEAKGYGFAVHNCESFLGEKKSRTAVSEAQ